MNIVKKISKWVIYFLLIPITYFVVSLILTTIAVDRKAQPAVSDTSIFLATNGVHLDIVLPKSDLDSLLLSGLKHDTTERYLSFGWGDENFYINTPTWGDLTFNNAFRALFLNSTTLVHVTRHKQKDPGWVEVKVNASELQRLNAYLLHSFEKDESGMQILLENEGYSSADDFYKSKGSYSCFKTCNSWVNIGFKESGLKSCLWTPFDFGLINKYE